MYKPSETSEVEEKLSVSDLLRDDGDHDGGPARRLLAHLRDSGGAAAAVQPARRLHPLARLHHRADRAAHRAVPVVPRRAARALLA